MTELFIGSEKVISNEVVDQLVHYTMDNGQELTATIEQFTAIALPEAYDDGQITMRKFRPLIEQILELMKDNNVELADKGWILERIDESITQNHRSAVAKLYGVSTVERVSLQKIDDVLTSN